MRATPFKSHRETGADVDLLLPRGSKPFTMNLKAVAVVGLLVSVNGALVAAGEAPPGGTLERLASEEFREREMGQLELLAWGRKSPERTVDALYELTRSHQDPEVRRRCMGVLRELIFDEYLRDGGEGYVGIRMMEEQVAVPGDEGLRIGIRVTEVVEGTPAEKAGLVNGDLIVGMDDSVWREEGMIFEFGDEIRKLKAGTRVVLKLLKNDAVVELPLTLGRRPPGALERFPRMSAEELAAADRAAKERYFREWMDRRKEAR